VGEEGEERRFNSLKIRITKLARVKRGIGGTIKEARKSTVKKRERERESEGGH